MTCLACKRSLRRDVEAFSAQFPTIAFDEASMRYPYKA
jgi:hypothetical protein